MEIKLLVAGIATGLAMSIPIGAVNLLIIRTALNRGFRAAALAALGAVLADAIMASIVVLGIRSIAGWIAAYAVPLQILGGLLLVVVGVRTALSHFRDADLASFGHAAKIGLTFWLCISNPALYFGYAAILGAVTQALGAGQASLLLVAGVAIGSLSWWLFLSYVASRLGRKLSPRIMDRINRWSGIIVAALGFVLLFEAWSSIIAWFAR
jgi:threonine/homoserine/homoserine lactone efflux protein